MVRRRGSGEEGEVSEKEGERRDSVREGEQK